MKKYGDRYTGLIAMAAATAIWMTPLSAGQAGQSGQGQQGQTQTRPQPQTQPQPTMTAVTAKASDIAANPEKYYNKKVTVSDQVEEVIGMQVFTLDEDAAFAGPDVLVIAPALVQPIKDGEDVVVTGTLKPFVEAEIKRDYDWNWWADWKVEHTAKFKDRPVLLADSVKTKDGKELIKK